MKNLHSLTNGDIKKMLIDLEKTDVDFDVVMTGKGSRKVNGLYRFTPDENDPEGKEKREILLHNKNFGNTDQLVYTAVHEYTHHLICVERTKKKLPSQNNTSSHDAKFWAKMDDLLEIALKKGYYKRSRSEKLAGLINEAKEIDRRIASLQHKLGKVLAEIHKTSEEESVRYDDVLSHDLHIKQSTAKMAVKISNIDVKNLGSDEAATCSTAKSREEITMMRNSLEKGKSISQAKQESSNKEEYDIIDRLKKEKRRLEKTMGALVQRLEFVEEQIRSLKGSDG